MLNLNKTVWVIIPAAGIGKRMQAGLPKQYLKLQGRTVLEHTLDCFLGCAEIAGIVVVVGAEDRFWPELSAQFAGLPVFTVTGGQERAYSVLNGLDYLADTLGENADVVVMVHDAARPCLPQKDLHLLLAAVDNYADSGAILAMPVRDTMKRAVTRHAISTVSHTEEREGLWHALTPQMAGLKVLRAALQRALNDGAAITDEASALEYAGLQPRLLEGAASNIKITRPADLALAEFFLQQRLQEEEE